MGLLNPSGSDFFDNRNSVITFPVLEGFTASARFCAVTAAPTATLSTTANDPTNSTSLPFTVAFSEAVTSSPPPAST